MFNARKIKEFKYEYIDADEMVHRARYEGLISIPKEVNGWQPFAPPSPNGKGWLMVFVKYEEENDPKSK